MWGGAAGIHAGIHMVIRSMNEPGDFNQLNVISLSIKTRGRWN